ncbi:hypothetical protein BDV12DRAFT_190632 [Aspergillus spectabilis]
MNGSLNVDSLISGISRVADGLDHGYTITSRQQHQLREACARLSSRLSETTAQVQYSNSTAMKIAIDMGIFDYVCNSEKDEFTAAEIASATGADPVLVERIMRPLILTRLFSPTPKSTYKANKSAKQLASGSYMRDMVTFTQEVAEFVNLQLPEFLAKTRYQSPNRLASTPFQFTFKTRDSFYTWLQKRPALYSAFSGMMKALGDGASRWPDSFPAAERFKRFRGANVEQPLRIVDIAGGRGYNLQYLLDAVPDLQGELILQDLPEVLENWNENEPVPLHPGIRTMPHNFFEAQPVKAAHVYVLTQVLHNWPDAECRQILEHIKAAMDRDSVLLIGDKVFPSGAAEVSLADVTADMFMMMFFGAMERTESQFRVLLESVGLEVVKVWRATESGHAQDAVLEARLVE